MNQIPSFSERYGYQSQSKPKPITIRNEAPAFLREGILVIAEKSGFDPKILRSIICDVLDELPDVAHNWSDPNVIGECEELISSCEWFEIYDICEAIGHKAVLKGDSTFEKKLNVFFVKKGVGWKMEVGQISIRGEEDYEDVTLKAQGVLETSGKTTAAIELKEAIQDLSRRPTPDITGAIQHSMAALECFARDILGAKKTLGACIKDLHLPTPIDEAVEKMWGFASEQGRHVKEGRNPNFPEAILTVHFCAALIVYLTEKNESS
jgi:hypothetical protein